MRRRLRIPEDIHHPVPVSILQQLKAIDPPRKRSRILRTMPRLIRAPNLSDIAKLLDFIVNRPLEESHRRHPAVAARNISVNRQNDRIRMPARRSRRRDKPRIRNEQRTHPVPVPRLALAPGDHAIHRMNNGLRRSNILRLRHRLARMPRDRAHQRSRRSLCSGCGLCSRHRGLRHPHSPRCSKENPSQ
jgi:hypothetical protein